MLEIVLGGILEMEKFRWFLLEFWDFYFFFATEKFRCSCIRLEEFFVCPLKNNSSPMDTGTWTYVDDFISCSHDIFVMFDNYDGIPEINELSEVGDQESTITRMKSYRWFIEDIGDALKACPHLRGKSDTL